MNVQETGIPTSRKIREDVTGGNVVDRIFKFSTHDFNTFLSGWKRAAKNYKTINNALFQTLLVEYPSYLELFQMDDGEIEQDIGPFDSEEIFLSHTRAVLRGINTVVKNLTGKYEEENEFLPIITYTHLKRGVTMKMMKILKQCLVEVCSDILMLQKREVASWNVVLEFIFQDYLYKHYPK